VLRRNTKECVYALLQAVWIILPYQVLQENTGAIESDALRKSQFSIDRGWIERLFLPHFSSIYGVGRYVVEAH
jgi:hypothetical protein